MEFTLTECQEKAKTMLTAFVASESSWASIQGSAGVGKTHMMKEVATLVPRGSMIATAPTNKACGVLASFLEESLGCLTIHRFLGLTVKYHRGEKVSKKKTNYDPFQFANIKYVIVDESSMLDDNLLKHIKKDAKDWDRKYIFVGDPCQLPPIEGNLKISECFSLAPEEFSVEMTEIVRQQKDNPIIICATNYRDAIEEGVEPKLVGGRNLEKATGVFLYRKMAWDAALDKILLDERFLEDIDFCRIIAYTNRAVNSYNQHVRALLGNDTSLPFEIGDKILVNTAFEVDRQIVLTNGEERIVEGLRESEHSLLGFKDWAVYLEGSETEFFVLDETSKEPYKAALETMRLEAKSKDSWGGFYELLNHYADLRPPYSLTAHNAQGSTFRNVFVDLKDIYKNRILATADKCFYVAVTRASNNAFILN